MPFDRRRRSIKRKNYFSLLFVLFGLKKKITDNQTGTKTVMKSRLTSIPVISCSDKRMLINKSENLIVFRDGSFRVQRFSANKLVSRIGRQTLTLEFLEGELTIASSVVETTTTIAIYFMQVISSGGGKICKLHFDIT